MSQDAHPSHAISAEPAQEQAIASMDANEASLSGNMAEHSENKCAQCSGRSAEGEEAAARGQSEGVEQSAPLTTEPELASAVNMLAQVALQMDDPVQALEDGVDALAEALVARQIAAQQQADQQRSADRQREADMAEWQDAYHHARLHRVGELIDVGYSLDQAIGITHANEAEIRQRAVSAGRDPNAVIYEYAVRHGYRPYSGREQVTTTRGPRRPAEMPPRTPTAMEQLANLSDEAFAEATRGDRWQRLLKAR
jgi:hypothetical protein